MAEGHFNNSGAYGPLVAKFGLPPEPAAASTDEVALVEGGEDAPATEPTETDGLVIDASGTALDGTPPAPEAEGASEPGLDEILLDEPAPDESTTTESGLLDIDSLLMEELVNEQTVIEEIVEQIDETSDEKPVTDDTTDVAV